MNPYKVLEVSESASYDEIRKSYRKLARKYHPDSNPGNKSAEEKFKQINDAYTILSDEEKRAEYDAKKNAKAEQHMKGSSGTNGFGGQRQFNKADIFGQGFFGQNPFGQNPFGQNPLNKDETGERKETSFGYGVDKQSVNQQFANFFGFGQKNK